MNDDIKVDWEKWLADLAEQPGDKFTKRNALFTIKPHGAIQLRAMAAERELAELKPRYKCRSARTATRRMTSWKSCRPSSTHRRQKMKITWNKNPLNTTIELDDHEKEVLWYKIKVEELEEDISSAAVYLDPAHASWTMTPSPRRPQPHTLETLVAEVCKNHLDSGFIIAEGDEKSKLDQRVDTLLEHYLEELVSSHAGDCTCFPMSCSKCHAEQLLGIDTTKGLGKHSAHKILGAFGKDGTRSMNDALAALRDYNPKLNAEGTDAAWKKVGGFEQHIPRWTTEAKAAYGWLLEYRNTHFKDQS